MPGKSGTAKSRNYFPLLFLRSQHDGIIVPDTSAMDNFGDDAGTIEEGLSETYRLAEKVGWTLTGITVFDAVHEYTADLEVIVDEPRQFHVHGDNVAPAFRELKTTVFEKHAIDQGDLTLANVSFTEASVAGAVAISFEAAACDGLRGIYISHESAGVGGYEHRHYSLFFCVFLHKNSFRIYL